MRSAVVVYLGPTQPSRCKNGMSSSYILSRKNAAHVSCHPTVGLWHPSVVMQTSDASWLYLQSELRCARQLTTIQVLQVRSTSSENARCRLRHADAEIKLLRARVQEVGSRIISGLRLELYRIERYVLASDDDSTMVRVAHVS